MTRTGQKSKLLSTQEAASYLGVTKDYLRRLIREGSIPSYNIGKETRKTYRIKESDLDAWMNERKVVGRVSDEKGKQWRKRSVTAIYSKGSPCRPNVC